MAFTTDFKRILRSGVISFWRNGVVSLASILVMTVTLFVIGSLLFLNAVLDFSIEQVERRVDINIYFYPSATEGKILDVKELLEKLPQVHSIAYVSREEAIEQFRDRHKDNALTLQALEELSENPLGASLNVRANDPSQYGAIASFLSEEASLSPDESSIIERVNYNQNKLIIDRLTTITATSQRLGLAVSIVFIILSVLITFNTIRLAIYSAREEIEVMRLVGAENAYIRGPFMMQGVVSGAIAAVIALAIFYPLTWWISQHTRVFFGGMDIFYYYINNFPQILIIILGTGVFVGAFSSFLAVRKYLKK